MRFAVDALRGWQTWVIAGIALAVLLRWKINAAWVVLAGGIVGFLVVR